MRIDPFRSCAGATSASVCGTPSRSSTTISSQLFAMPTRPAVEPSSPVIEREHGLVGRQPVGHPAHEPEPESADGIGLQPYRVVVRDAAPRRDGSTRRSRAPRSRPDRMQGPPQRQQRREMRVGCRVGPLPPRRQETLGLGDPTAQDRQVAQRRVPQRSRFEPRDVARERGRLQEIAGADDGVDRAQQPLLALVPVDAHPAGLDQRGSRARPGAPSHLCAGRRHRGRRRPPRSAAWRRRPGGAARHLRRRPTRPRRGAAGPGSSGHMLVDGRLHQGMRERDVPDVDLVGGLQQPDGDRFLEGVHRIVEPGQRCAHLQRGSDTQHRAGLDQRSCRRAAGRQPIDDLGREGTRRRERRLPGVPPIGRELGQQRPHVERVATGVVAQPLGRPQAELRYAERRRQRLDLTALERLQADVLARGGARQPSEAVGHPQRVLVPGHGRVSTRAREPAKGEQQRSERVDVRPVRVVDQQDDEPSAVRASRASPGATAPTPTGSSGGSARCLPASRSPPLTPAARSSWSITPKATSASHCSPLARRSAGVVELGEELLDQRCLADPRRPGHQDRLRLARTHLGQGTPQRRELASPADERIGFLRHEHVLTFGGRDPQRADRAAEI